MLKMEMQELASLKMNEEKVAELSKQNLLIQSLQTRIKTLSSDLEEKGEKFDIL